MNEKDSMVLFLLRFATLAAIAITAYVGYVVIKSNEMNPLTALMIGAFILIVFTTKKAKVTKND